MVYSENVYDNVQDSYNKLRCTLIIKNDTIAAS